MKCTKLFQTIDELNDAYIRVWEDVCNIESPSADKAGVDAVGAYFTAMAKERGWEILVHEEEVSGNALSITMNGEAKGQMICVSGHMDTVFPHGMFGTPPVRIEGDKIYGPGVVDCKGGIVAAFYAMDALRLCGFEDRPVRLLLQSDEEVSSRTSKRHTIEFMCEQSKGAAAFLNCEAFREKLVVSRKGVMNYRFTVHGKATHSAICYNGVSAIAEAAHKILELEKWKDEDGLTCSCGVIEGGGVPNIVPDHCTFIANFRFTNMEEMHEAERKVREVAETSYLAGTTCTTEKISERVAMEADEKNLSLARRMNETYAENGLPVLECRRSNGASDASDLSAYGIPSVDSIGTEGGYYHTKDEYAYLRSLSESAKRIASVIYCWED